MLYCQNVVHSLFFYQQDYFPYFFLPKLFPLFLLKNILKYSCLRAFFLKILYFLACGALFSFLIFQVMRSSITRLHPRGKGGPFEALVWKTFKSLRSETSDRTSDGSDSLQNGQQIFDYESFCEPVMCFFFAQNPIFHLKWFENMEVIFYEKNMFFSGTHFSFLSFLISVLKIPKNRACFFIERICRKNHITHPYR